jgi:hypothetical protein
MLPKISLHYSNSGRGPDANTLQFCKFKDTKLTIKLVGY